jgi:hypothetical protein
MSQRRQASLRSRHAIALLACVTLAACTSDAPTSLLLQISADDGVGKLDALRLAVYSPRGLELSGYRLPAAGAPELPATVVLYPPAAGELRLSLRGRRGSAIVAEGSASAQVEAGTQSSASIVLQLGRLPDGDGDGVPDVIDDCPQLPDPDQQNPCAPDGGTPDAGDGGPRDAGDGDLQGDGPVDGGVDGPVDSFVPPDIIKGCTSPADCDDGNPCTDDRCELKACTYGPTICKPSGDPCKQAPRCDPAQGCVEDNRPDNTPCPDSAYCTVNEVCVGGACQTSPRDCQASAPICATGSCNESKNSCDYTVVPQGTSCDDGDLCTQGDSCTSAGQCVPTPKASVLLEAVNMDRRGSRTVVVDSKGAVHAVYSVSYGTSQHSLHYATNASGSWQVAVLEGPDNDAVGLAPSLAIDAQDRLHAAYASKGKLIYRRWGGGTPLLKQTLVDSDGYTSLTLDANVVHIAHGDDRGLHYAKRSASGAWAHAMLFTPTTSTNVTTSFDIALDAAGKVHVAHSRDAGGTTAGLANRLWHTSNESGSWQTTDVDTSAGAGHMPSLVIDKAGALHIVYGLLDGQNGQLAIVTRAASPTSSWSKVIIDSSNKTGSFPTALLGAADKLHVVYRNFDKGELRYTNNISGSWAAPLKIEALGTGTGRWASAARTDDGRIHVVYELQGTNGIRYASFSACP